MDGEAWKLRQKESVYRKLYSDLLQKHRGDLQQAQLSTSTPPESESTSRSQHDGESSLPPSSSGTARKDLYEDENNKLNQIFRTEVGNLVFGVASTAISFLVLRLGKIRILSSSLFGGIKTAEIFNVADAHARQYGTEHTQNRISTLIEGMFSLWVGFRCYDYASHRSTSTWQAVADIPLCSGRSRVSEALCLDWVDTTHSKIPSEFWVAVSDGSVRDPRTWKAIQTFSMNCERRWTEEHRIRQEGGLLDKTQPVVLPSRIESFNISMIKDINKDTSDNPKSR